MTGPSAVVTGFNPYSSHVATAPVANFQDTWNTDHGPSNADHGPMSLKCVSIVSELRQDLGVARCRDRSFNAKKVSRWVSRFASRCRDFCQSVSNRLESFQYSPKVRHSVHNRDTFATLLFNTRHLRDTLGVAIFCSIERLIPMLLGDNTVLKGHRDTFPDFLAQINKKNIKYPFRYRDHSLPYFRHNWGSINLTCKSPYF